MEERITKLIFNTLFMFMCVWIWIMIFLCYYDANVPHDNDEFERDKKNKS